MKHRSLKILKQLREMPGWLMHFSPLMSSQFHPRGCWGCWLDLRSVKQGVVQRYPQRMWQNQTCHHSMCPQTGCAWLHVKVIVMIGIQLFLFSQKGNQTLYLVAVLLMTEVQNFALFDQDWIESDWRGIGNSESVTVLNEMYIHIFFLL